MRSWILALLVLLGVGCSSKSEDDDNAVVLSHANKSVLTLSSQMEKGVASCSGFYVGEHLIITAAHCVEEPSAISTIVGETAIPLEIVAFSSNMDVALLTGEIPASVPALPMAGAPPKLMEELFFAGSTPRMDIGTFMVPVRMVWAGVHYGVETIMTSDGMYAGLSGGPLLNKKGQVVGVARGVTMFPMVTADSDPSQHYHKEFSNAAPTSSIFQLLEMTLSHLSEEDDPG